MMARLRSAGLRAGRLAVSRSAFEVLEERRMLCADHFVDESGIFLEPDFANVLNASTSSGGRASGDDLPGLPDLHSLPGAPAAIYLDFDGHVTATVNDRGFTLDSDYTTFNAQEAADITTAWRRVAAYFGMFNVDVTTKKPTVPFAWQLTSPDHGGHSVVGAFPSNNVNPATWNNSDSVTARTSAYGHELGHNFGMQHQAEWNALGERTAEYTDGYDKQHGSIMGSDWAQVIRKWFIGHDTTADGAYTLQNDIQIVLNDLDNLGSAALGTADGYRRDLVGNTTATATPLLVSGVNQYMNASVLDENTMTIIERPTDVDVFSFTSTGGRYLISAFRENESAVDLKIEVRNSAGTLLASEDIFNKNDADVALNLPAGTYYLSVMSHGNYGDQGLYNVQVSPIAAGFDSMDVTLARRAGSTSYDPSTGVWTLLAGGRPETTSTSNSKTTAYDEMRYAYTQLRGNGEIVARVSTNAANSGAFAGLMIRENLNNDARFAMANIVPGGSVQFTRRTSVGGTHAITSSAGVAAPYYLKLVRSGNSFSAYRATSLTGTWTQVGTTQTVTMGTDVFIGMAATSEAENFLIGATFSEMSVSGDTGAAVYTSNGLAAPTNVAVTQGTGSGLNVAWTAVAGATGYIIERSFDGENFVQAGTTTSATTFSDPNLEGSNRYYYRVFATNGTANARSLVSTSGNGVNRPSAVPSIWTMSTHQTRIVIDWRDTVGETGYRIERSIDGTNWSIIGSVGANVPSYNDTTVTVGKVYQYRVIPTSATGDGGTSAVVSEGSRLLIVNSTAVTAVTSTSATLTWSDINSIETGYKIQRSTDNDAWTTVTTVGPDVTTYTNSGLATMTGYYWRVQAVSDLTESSYDTSPAFAVLPATAALPTPYEQVNIGDTPTFAGRVSHSAGTYTFVNASTDIGGSADDLTFMYRAMTGDVEIIARVASLTDIVGAESGLMFRSSLNDNSPYAMAIITNDADSRFNRRLTVGGGTSTNNGPNRADGTNVIAPYWLKLGRVGDVVTASQSVDGVTWVAIGSATVALGTNIFVGLALSSHNIEMMAKATFTNLTVTGTGAGPIDTTAPDAPTFGAISDDTGLSATDGITTDSTIVLSGTAEPGSTVTVKRGTATIGSVVAAPNGVWGIDYSAVTLPEGVTTFTATATDAANNVSAVSTMAVTVDTSTPTVGFARFAPNLGHRFEIAFSENVFDSIEDPDFVVIAEDGETTYAVDVLTYDSSFNMVTLTMPTGTYLPDGNYTLKMLANTVGDLAGNTAAERLQTFKVLTGDANSDGVVGFEDLLVVAQNYGASGKNYSQGNFSYDVDGKVDFDDLLLLAQHYGAGSAMTAFAQAQAQVAAASKATTLATKRKTTTADFGRTVIA